MAARLNDDPQSAVRDKGEDYLTLNGRKAHTIQSNARRYLALARS